MMQPSIASQQYTPEDLLAMPDGHRFDLVDGHLVERNRGAESSWIAQQINHRLCTYAETSQHGLVLGPDCGYQISEKHALKTLQCSQILQGMSQLTTTALGQNPALFDQIINQLSTTLFEHGLDHDLEYDADRLGMDYAYRVGYAPQGLATFLTRLAQSHGSVPACCSRLWCRNTASALADRRCNNASPR